MNFIERPLYMDKLIGSIKNNRIKILSGVRGVGKTSILKMFQEKLNPDETIYIDFESAEYFFITESVGLYEHLSGKITPTEFRYLILDEIQRIKDWQKVIAALKTDFNVDIYIAVSRTNNLEELGDVTLIEILPLSFKESQCENFEEYLNGSMPAIITKDSNKVSDIFYSAIAQDVLIANKIADNDVLMLLLRILISETGKIHSFNSLSKLLNEVVEKAPAVRTIESYIKFLTDARIIYNVPVFDFKSDHQLSRYAKYYPCDLGFYKIIMGRINLTDIHILESVIYFELLRLNVKVTTGKSVSFIAENNDNKIYVQVSGRQWKRRNVIKPIRTIKDHYSKWILTLDETYTHSKDGIRIINIEDFLREE